MMDRLPPGRTRDAAVAPESTIAEAIARLERAETGMLLLCQPDGTLFGVLTDGDIRRAILKGIPFEHACGTIASRHPVIADPTVTETEALRLMDHGTSFPVDHLPIVDDGGRVVRLMLRRDLMTLDGPGFSAVIMAGGLGQRLQPLTDTTPKPMLPVGDRPLLELTIEQLRRAGIRRVNITTHYLADRITSHFGNGDGFGVDVRYVTEDQPLGTAGALRYVEPREEPLLVINGDIFTRVDFRDMVAFHRERGAAATVGVRRLEVAIPYGVVDCDGPAVRALREKPSLTVLVNAGIYLLEPVVYRYLPAEGRYDMTDLLQRLLAERQPVVSFPIVESWIDIGQHADYQRAQQLVSHEPA
jgi:dTDP-glucose pyrophosphorylase/CBS domain-containing protein